MHRKRKTFVMVVIVLVILAMTLPAIAGPSEPVDNAASATQTAQRVARQPVDVDLVSISNFRTLRSDVEQRAITAVTDAGGTHALGRSASLPMKRITRGDTTVQAASSRFSVPMGTTVLPTSAVAALMGSDVAAAMRASSIVMSELTASLRGAEAGDRIDLVASSGAVRTFTIGAVVADEITGGTELLISDKIADLLGVTGTSRIVLWGFASQAAIDAALEHVELATAADIRVTRSWDPFRPDSTLGMARTKAALGEFEYRVNSSGSVVLDSAWHDANISREGPIGRLNLRSGCHVVVREALQDAIDELIEVGLDDTINYDNANSAGGCFVPRFNRRTPNSAIGFLSRHTWGMAVDTNTVGSCQGCDPPDFATMPGGCDAVQIFRKHGFAWGGNFVRPDGMHFEWVGEPRDQISYPSRFCPNVVDTRALAAPGAATERASMFADDGLVVHG